MAKEPPHRHNGGPLSDEMREKLWNHIRALEALDEAMADLRLDVTARKELAKIDGFDTNMLAVIVKRRKAGEGETAAADDLIRIYEEGLRDQGALPLEQTRKPGTPRRSLDQIAEDLHGEALPPKPGADQPAEMLHEIARRMGGTITVEGDSGVKVTFGGSPPPMFD